MNSFFSNPSLLLSPSSWVLLELLIAQEKKKKKKTKNKNKN
jgi:hypothetical protein